MCPTVKIVTTKSSEQNFAIESGSVRQIQGYQSQGHKEIKLLHWNMKF